MLSKPRILSLFLNSFNRLSYLVSINAGVGEHFSKGNKPGEWSDVEWADGCTKLILYHIVTELVLQVTRHVTQV